MVFNQSRDSAKYIDQHVFNIVPWFLVYTFRHVGWVSGLGLDSAWFEFKDAKFFKAQP
jgi:hypothetical protein